MSLQRGVLLQCAEDRMAMSRCEDTNTPTAFAHRLAPEHLTSYIPTSIRRRMFTLTKEHGVPPAGRSASQSKSGIRC